MRRRISVHEFVDELSATLQEYLDEKSFYKNPVLTIGHDKDGVIAFEIHEEDRKKHLPNGVEYAITDFYVHDELGVELPNFEVMNQVAQIWVAKQ